MPTLTEPAADVQGEAKATDLERLQQAVAWLAANAPDAEVQAVYATYCGSTCATIFLRELADLKRLFPGCTARVVREGGRREYTVTRDGLAFRATEWIRENMDRVESEVEL